MAFFKNNIALLNRQKHTFRNQVYYIHTNTTNGTYDDDNDTINNNSDNNDYDGDGIRKCVLNSDPS